MTVHRLSHGVTSWNNRAATSEPFPPLPPAFLPVPPSPPVPLFPSRNVTSHVDEHVLGTAAAAAAADAYANHIAREIDSDAPMQLTTTCRICGQTHLNHVDGMCSRCHNPLTAEVAALNNDRASFFERQQELAERFSTDSVAVRVHTGEQGNRGLHRPRPPARMDRQKVLEIQIRFRRLGFQTGVDMFNETNWSAKNGSTTAQKPPDWRYRMDSQREHDYRHDRDLQFYEDLDQRLASYMKVYKPMSIHERVARWGGHMSVRPQPGAPPLSRQQNVGRIIEQCAEANSRNRERSRSRDVPWQGSTAESSSTARSSSWRSDEWHHR